MSSSVPKTSNSLEDEDGKFSAEHLAFLALHSFKTRHETTIFDRFRKQFPPANYEDSEIKRKLTAIKKIEDYDQYRTEAEKYEWYEPPPEGDERGSKSVD